MHFVHLVDQRGQSSLTNVSPLLHYANLEPEIIIFSENIS